MNGTSTIKRKRKSRKKKPSIACHFQSIVVFSSYTGKVYRNWTNGNSKSGINMQARIPNIAMAIQAYAAHQPGSKLELYEYEVGSLKPDEVEIYVEYCGICRSDLSMLKNEWWRQSARSFSTHSHQPSTFFIIFSRGFLQLISGYVLLS